MKLLFASWIVVSVVPNLMAEPLCLPDGIPEEHRTSLPSENGTMPVGIMVGNWPSSKLLSQIVLILIKEVIGYAAQIGEVYGSDGQSTMYGLAGCLEYNSPKDKKCGGQETRLHVSTDAWIGGYLLDFERMQQDFPEIAPEDLGSVGYNGEETMYVSEPVFERAYEETGAILSHHKGYNRSHHNAKQFFDSVSDFLLSDLKRCNESELNNPVRMEPYAEFSGDWNGVVKVNDRTVAYCPDEYWWISPDCRDDTSQCIPLITGGNGWRIQALMQWAAAYAIPVAVAVSIDYARYGELISTKKVLFYWWLPDNTFIEMQPLQVQFPRHNPAEWAEGDKKTSLATSYISNMVSGDLNDKAPKVRAFMSKMRFSLLEVQDMLLETKQNNDDYGTACNWVKENRKTWEAWEPVETNCQEGFGMVNGQDHFVEQRSDAKSCGLCMAGTYSAQISDQVGKTFICLPCEPGSSQENTFSTKCEPCPRGQISDKFGSISCVPCGVGEYQPNQGQTSCLTCADSFTTQLLGATRQEDCVCKAGFIEDGDRKCILCQKGVRCPLGSTLGKLLNSTGADDVPSIQVGHSSTESAPLDTYLCPDFACPGGSPGTCGGGRIGTTCALCPEGEFFSEDGGACTPCSEGFLFIFLLIGCPCFVIGSLGGYYILPSKYNPKANPGFIASSLIGLAIALLQIFGVLGTVLEKDVSNSALFPKFATVFILNFDAWGASCAGKNTVTYGATSMFFWCFPIALALLGLITQKIPMLKRMAWTRFRTINLMGNFFMSAFTTVGSLALVPFMCFKHPMGKFSVLKYPEIFCSSPEHSLLQIFGVLLILLAVFFAAGCGFGVWFAPRWSVDRQTRPRLEMFTFLLHRFRPDYWWFGLVLLVRGVAVSVPSVFFAGNPSLVKLLLCFVLLSYFGVIVSIRPWKSPLLNALDASTMGLLLALLVIFLTDPNRVTEALQALTMASIFFLLFAALLVALANWYQHKKGGGDLKLVNLGDVPDLDRVVTSLEDLGDHLASLDNGNGKEKMLEHLRCLSSYDLRYMMVAVSLMEDHFQVQARNKAYTIRVVPQNSRVFSKQIPKRKTDIDPLEVGGEAKLEGGEGCNDASVRAEALEASTMQDEMYENPEGKQILVSQQL